MATCCAYGALVVTLFLRRYELIRFSKLSDYDPDAGGTSADEGLGFDRTEEFEVGGMMCASCVASIESRLLQRKGIKRVNASFLLNQVVVWYNRLLVTPEAIRKDIEAIGFSTSPACAGRGKNKGFIWNWGEAFSWSLLFTIPILVLQAVPDMLCNLRQRQLYSLILAGFVQFGFGIPFYRSTFMALNSGGLRHLPMNFAIAWSTSVAYTVSVYCYATAVHESYAATTASLITVISLGKHLETRARTSVTATLRAFSEMVPSTALLQTSKERIPSSMLRSGDVVEVPPGTRFPCDSIVIDAKGCALPLELDESFHTGESRPVPKELGDICLAGTTNTSSKPAVVEVVSDGESRLGAIVSAVVAAQSAKSDTQLLTERMVSYVVPLTLLLSLLTFILWIPVGFFPAIRYMTATLVVVCPCALSISSPMATMIGSVGARNGILIKTGARAFENAARIGTVVVDKTGTLTLGRMTVTGFKIHGAWEQHQWWHLVRTAEEGCEHWASETICKHVQAENGRLTGRDDYTYIPGRGIRCSIRGTSVLVGNMQHLQEAVTNDIELAILDSRSLNQATNCVFVALDRRYAGYIAMEDQLHAEALPTIRELRSLGLKVYMITGDREAIAARVAKALEIEQYWAEKSPHDKLELVKELQKTERVAMVGDGVNDAPALAGASVGIALQRSAAPALASADIVLLQPSIGQILPALKLAKYTFRTIQANILWTCIYNLLTVPLAMGLGEKWGLSLPPTIAGFLMMGSSLAVAFNSQRLDHSLTDELTNVTMRQQ